MSDISSNNSIDLPAELPRVFIQEQILSDRPAPSTDSGVFGWLLRNLFQNVWQTIASIVTIFFLGWLFWHIAEFAILNAVWVGDDREACSVEIGRSLGACWAFVGDRLGYFIYGSYPIEERWRVNVFFFIGAVVLAHVLWLNAPFKRLGLLAGFVLFPVVAFVLLNGWPVLGLSQVTTDRWGGLMVTLVVAGVGIVAALPIGIILALGRRSKLPVVRLFSIALIELPRGVPLITVLFLANTMLPLFLPADVNPDKLVRALVGITFFAAAYLAEIVRGGLQAVPLGQYEASQALGLGYWRTMAFVVLPQAIKVAVPNIVSINIGLFKDTSLLLIVGIFDFLSAVETARIDPQWAAPTVSATGYAFAAMVYFVFCFGMSRYGSFTEKHLSRGHNN